MNNENHIKDTKSTKYKWLINGIVFALIWLAIMSFYKYIIEGVEFTWIHISGLLLGAIIGGLIYGFLMKLITQYNVKRKNKQ